MHLHNCYVHDLDKVSNTRRVCFRKLWQLIEFVLVRSLCMIHGWYGYLCSKDALSLDLTISRELHVKHNMDS